jgi:hypothetical protein
MPFQFGHTCTILGKKRHFIICKYLIIIYMHFRYDLGKEQENLQTWGLRQSNGLIY